MFKEDDLSNGPENLRTNPKNPVAFCDRDNPDEKIDFFEMGRRFLQEYELGNSGFRSRSSKSGSQELTLRYLCENPQKGSQEKEISGESPFGLVEEGRGKGKEVVMDSMDDRDRWVERDFLQLNGNKGFKRENLCSKEEIGYLKCEKKAKMEALNLSLAPPNTSLSLASSNPLPNPDPPRMAHSVQSWAPSSNFTRTSSDDFAGSLSYSYSRQFSHNLSCSLTHNSTENYDNSYGRRENDQIWHCGEGTNGSVHSRFKPVGDSTNFTGQIDHSNNLHRTTSSENLSFFPSELPARSRKDTRSANSRGKCFANSDASPGKILWEIVSESVPVMAQILQEVSNEALDAAKEHLKSLLVGQEIKEDFAGLRRLLDRRNDLTFETLSKCHKVQLDILVTIKTGIVSYISGRTSVPSTELVDIFLLSRCRNISCKSILPVDDCDCKICSTQKGFCSACMCPICMNFDCASNTCSWVGCDVCSHWCHVGCGLQMNLIKPGPSSKGAMGNTEMQFYCQGCGHASELFGFVKEVFSCFAKDWSLESLTKELDCVRKIFRISLDFKGKKLHNKTEEMLGKLEKKHISLSDACNGILQFFKDGVSEFSAVDGSSKGLIPASGSVLSAEARLPPPTSVPPNPIYNINTPTFRTKIHQSHKESLPIERSPYAELNFADLKRDEFDNLETIVRIKEAEARMFQSKADDARRDAEGLQQLVCAKSKKLDEEYVKKLAKLCLQETEERRKKKIEELKMLENSQCDYYKMKLRMEAEIAGLLERMKVMKQKQWV